MKEILDLASQYNEFKLGYEFINQGKTLEQFQKALLEKKLSEASPISQDGEQKELGKFSFGGYVTEVLKGIDGKHSGLARELTQDAVKNGYKSHGGIVLPRHLVNEMRMKQVRAAGSYLAGTPAAFGNTAYVDNRAQIIDALYQNSIWNLMSTVYPDAENYGSVTLPVITSKNNVQMLGEGVAATKSRQETSHLTFTPKTAKASTSYTRDILKQSSLPQFESVVMNGLVKAMAEKRNQQWLNGTGTDGEIMGVFNASGVNAISNGTNGGALDLVKVVSFETALAAANVDIARGAYITNSKVAGSLKTTPRFANTGVALLENGYLNGYPVYVSNEIASDYTKGTGTGLSGMAFASPEDIAVMQWGGIEFKVNPFIEEDGGVRLDGWDSYDMQILRNISLAVSKDIIA
jgi:HK97 family phage major capsid protein